jgi:hypothetical protein
MQLFLVSDYMGEARTLLQDTVPPYRYTDDVLLTSINAAMLEISRLRPDILMDSKYQTRLNPAYNITDNVPPMFTSATETQIVPVGPQYKMAVTFYIAGFTQMIDVEDTTDARGVAFMSMFKAAMGAP